MNKEDERRCSKWRLNLGTGVKKEFFAGKAAGMGLVEL